MGTRKNRLADRVVLTSSHNLCFEQEYEKYQNFLSEIFLFFFLVVKFSIYLNRRVFVMNNEITRRQTGQMSKQLQPLPTDHILRG